MCSKHNKSCQSFERSFIKCQLYLFQLNLLKRKCGHIYLPPLEFTDFEVSSIVNEYYHPKNKKIWTKLKHKFLNFLPIKNIFKAIIVVKCRRIWEQSRPWRSASVGWHCPCTCRHRVLLHPCHCHPWCPSIVPIRWRSSFHPASIGIPCAPCR